MELLKIKLLADKKVIQETTNRIGIANKKRKILYPSCYIYEKDGEYYLVHFKELFMLRDTGYNNISEEDIKRRNAVAFCLSNWGLIEIENASKIEPHDIFVFVLHYKDKNDWKISHKINLFTLNR